MYVQRYVVPIVTDASGDATAYTPVFNGRILQIAYVKPSSGGFDDGVDFVLTLEKSATTVWEQDNVNASATVLPRQVVHSTAGAPEATVTEPIYCADERVKIIVAAGGNKKSGQFIVTAG